MTRDRRAAARGARAPSPPPILDATACAALAGANTTADWLGEGAEGALGEPLPAYCRLRGMLEPRIGERGVTYGTSFELRLPVRWNGRFLFQGGSGSDGIVFPRSA